MLFVKDVILTEGSCFAWGTKDGVPIDGSDGNLALIIMLSNPEPSRIINMANRPIIKSLIKIIINYKWYYE